MSESSVAGSDDHGDKNVGDVEVHPEVPRQAGVTRTELVVRLVVVGLLVVTAIQSVVVPRGLYADGAYNLWQVLNAQDYVVIGTPRTFAILLNQTPVVGAITLGVRDVDTLIAFYTFGVAALPVIIWIGAFLLQLRDRFYWPLVVTYGAAFLTSGFIAIGEYTYSFALVAMEMAVLMSPRPVRRWRAAALLFTGVALVLCYEGMVFLAGPGALVALVRLWRPRVLGLPQARGRERWYLIFSLVAACASVAVAGNSMLTRSRNSGDTNLAGALNLDFAYKMNLEWRVAAAIALLLVLSALVRPRVARVILQVVLLGATGLLFLEENKAPVWLHYNTRSLAALTCFALLVIAVIVVALQARRRARGHADETGETILGVAALALVFALSVTFWTSNARYGHWLGDFREVVAETSGPVEIATTDLFDAPRTQFSWGWTNPYLSALYQSEMGQGVVLSHVDTLDTYVGLDPEPSEWYFETYHRD